MHLRILPVLKDNYVYLIHDENRDVVLAIDPPQADPVLDALAMQDLALTHILSTHHHPDHTGGNLELRAKTGCEVVGYWGDAERIPGITRHLDNKEIFQIGQFSIEVMLIPGHTTGHIAYHFYHHDWLFCGDTLFSMGCGRLFEGTAQQMLESLKKLARLEDNTQVFCGHEYTEANGRFALSVEPGNPHLQARMREVKTLREQGKPTLPTTINEEKRTNPFLRANSPEIRKNLGMEEATDLEVFTKLRELKNNFS